MILISVFNYESTASQNCCPLKVGFVCFKLLLHYFIYNSYELQYFRSFPNMFILSLSSGCFSKAAPSSHTNATFYSLINSSLKLLRSRSIQKLLIFSNLCPVLRFDVVCLKEILSHGFLELYIYARSLMSFKLVDIFFKRIASF